MICIMHISECVFRGIMCYYIHYALYDKSLLNRACKWRIPIIALTIFFFPFFRYLKLGLRSDVAFLTLSLSRLQKSNNWYIVKVIGLLNSLGQNNYIALITNWLHLIYTFYIIYIQHRALVRLSAYTVYFVLKKFKCKLS